MIPPRVLSIIRIIAAEHGVTAEDVLGPSRKPKHVRPRWLAMAACLDLVMPGGTHPSRVQVGRWFGRDHTTVIHALRKVGEAQAELDFGRAA